MIVILVEPVKGNLDISDLDNHGRVKILSELATQPEPSLFDADKYRMWLSDCLDLALLGSPADEDVGFVVLGNAIKIAMMVSVLSEEFDTYKLLLFDSRYRRYVGAEVQRL